DVQVAVRLGREARVHAAAALALGELGRDALADEVQARGLRGSAFGGVAVVHRPWVFNGRAANFEGTTLPPGHRRPRPTPIPSIACVALSTIVSAVARSCLSLGAIATLLAVAMKRAIVLKHAPFEGPARIAELLADRGYEIEVRALHRGDPVPAALRS